MKKEDLLAVMLDSIEAQEMARIAFIDKWAADNRHAFFAGELPCSVPDLLADLGRYDLLECNQAFYLLMTEGEQGPLMAFISGMVTAYLKGIASTGWQSMVAEAEDGMTTEQWIIYKSRA